MKTGDIVMIYGNPIKLEYPIGEAKLISQIECHTPNLEYWNVSFLNEPELTRSVLIKKRNGEDKK